MNLTNKHNIALPLALWLATDDYDHHPGTISATALMKPLRQYILTGRLKREQMVVDISDLVASRMGTAIHDSIERAWLSDDLIFNLQRLGIPEDAIGRIVVNPTGEVAPGSFPVYMEQRVAKEIEGVTVTGKYDFVAAARVQDFKSTSTAAYTHGRNDAKYARQGSIYRWLNPDIIQDDVMNIHYIFTNWTSAKASSEGYPSSRVTTVEIPLYSIEETEEYVINKLRAIEACKQKDESELPKCTADDLWQTTTYKYYKSGDTSKRASKVFTTLHEAEERLAQDGNTGTILTHVSKAKACHWCPAYVLCSQKDELIVKGLLDEKVS